MATPRVGTCKCANPANSRIFMYNSANHSSPSPHVYTLANDDDRDGKTQVSGSKDGNSTTSGESNAVQKQAALHVVVMPQPVAAIPLPKWAKIPERRLCPPMDEMARLSVGKRGDVVRVDHPGHRLTSLEEEDANVDEARGVKRKRESDQEGDEYNNEEGEDKVVDKDKEEEPKAQET